MSRTARASASTISLSRGIVTRDGSPGPNYAKAAQFSAVVNNTFSISPGQKTPYNHTTSKVRAPGTSYAPQTCCTSVDQAALNGPGCLATLQLAAQADYGLRQQDLPLLTTGATGLPGNSPDPRVLDFDNLPNGPYPLVTLARGGETPTSLYDTYGGSPVHRFYQMWQELDCDVSRATHAIKRMPVRPLHLGGSDRLVGQQRQPNAEAAQGG